MNFTTNGLILSMMDSPLIYHQNATCKEAAPGVVLGIPRRGMLPQPTPQVIF